MSNNEKHFITRYSRLNNDTFIWYLNIQNVNLYPFYVALSVTLLHNCFVFLHVIVKIFLP